jgi:riboflavin kinase, archaea type
MAAEALELEGVVCSGSGEASAFTELDWVKRQVRERLGFSPHPGTFNLRMEGPAWECARARLATAAGVALEPADGLCRARCVGVSIARKVGGALVIPEVPGYPPDKFEVIAPVPVRAVLGLREGSRVTVRVELRDAQIASLSPH